MIKPGRQEVAMGTSSWASAYTSGTVKQQESVQQQPTATVPEETKETMSKKKASKATKPKSKKQTKRKAAAASNGAKLERYDKILGHSVCSVVRKMGAEGTKTDHARAILAKHKVTMPEASLRVQLGYGRAGQRGMAELTKEEFKELLASVPEPETAAVAA